VLAGAFFHLTESQGAERRFQLHTSGGNGDKNFNLQMPKFVQDMNSGEVLG